MATAQQDAEVQAYRTTTSSLQLKDISFGAQGVTLLCDMSTGRTMPIVPAGWRRQIFDSIHGSSHPSVLTTRKLMASKFNGTECKSRLDSEPSSALLVSLPRSTRTQKPLSRGLASPHDSFNTSMWIWWDLFLLRTATLTYSPSSTGFPVGQKPIPLSDTTSAICAHAFIAQWVTRFGVPHDISSDIGPQFTSQIWISVSQLLGVQLHHYHGLPPPVQWPRRKISSPPKGRSTSLPHWP